MAKIGFSRIRDLSPGCFIRFKWLSCQNQRPGLHEYVFHETQRLYDSKPARNDQSDSFLPTKQHSISKAG